MKQKEANCTNKQTKKKGTSCACSYNLQCPISNYISVEGYDKILLQTLRQKLPSTSKQREQKHSEVYQTVAYLSSWAITKISGTKTKNYKMYQKHCFHFSAITYLELQADGIVGTILWEPNPRDASEKAAYESYPSLPKKSNPTPFLYKTLIFDRDQ